MNSNRYNRQIRLEGFGQQGQDTLSRSRVCIVGAGGLGIPAAQYLNAMGIGKLGLIDGDQVELSNLHRQPLYDPGDVGASKVGVLSRFLARQNPDTRIEIHDTFLHAGNALEVLDGYDLILDATDNLATRYLIDDACLILDIPWVYGALHGFEGQVSVFNLQKGPTYRCLFPQQPVEGEIPNCSEMGTLGVLPGIVGMVQALEAVKTLCQLPGILRGSLWLYNGLDQDVQCIKFYRDPKRIIPVQLAPEAYRMPACADQTSAISVAQYQQLRAADTPHLLVDVREPDEYETWSVPGSVNIPLGGLENALSRLREAGPIYFICKTGPRSLEACQMLSGKLNTTEIRWIEGGIRQYKVESL
jgi:adenylyltransferase/sulfurtransferase